MVLNMGLQQQRHILTCSSVTSFSAILGSWCEVGVLGVAPIPVTEVWEWAVGQEAWRAPQKAAAAA